MENKSDYYSEDITFCANKCGNVDCFRNEKNIRRHYIPHSFSFFKDTDYCEGYRNDTKRVAGI